MDGEVSGRSEGRETGRQVGVEKSEELHNCLDRGGEGLSGWSCFL